MIFPTAHPPSSLIAVRVKLFRSPIRRKQSDNKIAMRVRLEMHTRFCRDLKGGKNIRSSFGLGNGGAGEREEGEEGRFQFSFRARTAPFRRPLRRNGQHARTPARPGSSFSLDILSFPSNADVTSAVTRRVILSEGPSWKLRVLSQQPQTRRTVYRDVRNDDQRSFPAALRG